MTALPAADPPAADPRGAVQADVEVEDAQSSNVPLEAGDVPSEAVQSDVPVPSPDLLQRTGTYLRRMTSPGTSAVPAGADPPAADAPSDDLLARTGTYLRRMTRGKSAAPAVDAPAATAQADAQADARAAVPTTLHQPPLLTRTGHYLRRETLRLVWRARGDGAGASAPERNTAVKFVEAVVAEFVAAETKEFRKSDVSNFAWATNGTFLNHGGLGGPSRGVQRLRGFADEVANRQPMAWYRDAAPALMSRAKEVGVTRLETASRRCLETASRRIAPRRVSDGPPRNDALLSNRWSAATSASPTFPASSLCKTSPSAYSQCWSLLICSRATCW
mmetsp:Transcript_28897/g.97437  ORF Transcript_28897/g.97437 Transcript_28897/m.97437 type:complete len:333 (-) Transcript_28897:786-1784(-)